MIRELALYPRMKETGLRWLGDVPEHWDVIPLRHLGGFFKGQGGTRDDNAEFGVPCVRYGAIYSKYNGFIRTPKTFINESDAPSYTPLEYGDALFAGSGETIEEIGKSAVNLVTGEAYCGGNVIVMRPQGNLVPHFLGYALSSEPVVVQKSQTGVGVTRTCEGMRRILLRRARTSNNLLRD